MPWFPEGAQCVGGAVYVSLASISPLLHPRPSLKANRVPAEEFLHPARACALSCTTHLLLIKQWQQSAENVGLRRWKPCERKCEKANVDLWIIARAKELVLKCDLLLLFNVALVVTLHMIFCPVVSRFQTSDTLQEIKGKSRDLKELNIYKKKMTWHWMLKHASLFLPLDWSWTFLYHIPLKSRLLCQTVH